MCVCEFEDLFLDRINVIEKRVRPFGLNGTLETRVLFFGPCPEEAPEDSLDEEGAPDAYKLNVEVSSGHYAEDIIEDIYIPIQFCPFCGRSLEAKVDTDNRKWFSGEQVACAFDVCPATVRRWRRQGALKGTAMVPEETMRSAYFYKMSDLDYFMKNAKKFKVRGLSSIRYGDDKLDWFDRYDYYIAVKPNSKRLKHVCTATLSDKEEE